MYKVVYHLTDGSVVDVEFDGYSKKNIVQLIIKMERTISTNGTIRVQKRMLAGYPKIISINTKYITHIEYINPDDEVTENN